MLVRALKVLWFFHKETTRTVTATAALNQPGDGRLRLWQSGSQLATMNRETVMLDT
jgi:hypothetical protein